MLSIVDRDALVLSRYAFSGEKATANLARRLRRASSGTQVRDRYCPFSFVESQFKIVMTNIVRQPLHEIFLDEQIIARPLSPMLRCQI